MDEQFTLGPGPIPDDYDGRPTQPWMLLVTEIDAAAALLDHTDAILRTIRFNNKHLEPLLTVWSIGAEKLLKLTIGMVYTEEHGTWPSVQTMRNEYGHDITNLDAVCRGLIADRLDAATYRAVVQADLNAVSEDDVIAAGLDVLTRYASKGRFFYLDSLANAPQPQPAPSELWDDILTGIVTGDPELRLGQTLPETELAIRQMFERVRTAMRTWRTLYYRAWIQGICGEHARGYGWRFQPPN